MSFLYRRLALDKAAAQLAALDSLSIADLRDIARDDDEELTIAATGGTPAGPGHTHELVDAIRAVAASHGYPSAPSTDQRTAFDRGAAVELHRMMQITLSEAAARDIWSFLAIVAAPDVVAWRWGASANVERWICKDITRHSLGRLWWQAETLSEVESDGQRNYALVDALAESELNQVFERRRIGGQPALARAIARFAARLQKEEASKRLVLREIIKRLLRALPFTALSILDEAQLDDTISIYAADAMASLGEP